MARFVTMDGAPGVVQSLNVLLEERGGISFEEFMERALYLPGQGLYRRSCPSVGKAGHYTTCAHLDPALGEAIAWWLVNRKRYDLGAPLRWNIIEIGGGDGSLAETVLDAIPRRYRWGLTFYMVEISEKGRALQQERLRGRGVVWSSSVAEALARSGGVALIFSNELVDAFPAVVVERRNGAWQEVFLIREGEKLVEQLRPAPAWLSSGGAFSLANLKSVPERGRAEIHRSFWLWLRTWAALWRRGSMLTLDYGGECGELYGRGGKGTMRAYFSNIRLEDPEDLYHRLGLQDLTCDVNTTDLTKWGERLGLESVALWSQRELLERAAPHLDLALRPSLSFIADPNGAGKHFFALWQRKM